MLIVTSGLFGHFVEHRPTDWYSLPPQKSMRLAQVDIHRAEIPRAL